MAIRFFLLFTALSPVFSWGAWELQSEFSGPVNLNVWRHWQASWNVEEVDASSLANHFVLSRGREGGRPVVRLSFQGIGDSARLDCRAIVRKDTWRVEEENNTPIFASRASGGLSDSSSSFIFSGADACLDQLGQRIVTEIRFSVSDRNGATFSYGLRPMYVRGKNASYWDNPIDPYSAHAGTGLIRVATAMTAESGWDRWDGVLVRPTLNFVDRNMMSAGGRVGLHRHEANQELYFIESGRALMKMGMAPKASSNRSVLRRWSGSGGDQATEEFSAEGGWLETRSLEAGEIAVIVPNSENRDTVYFHGIDAQTDLIFWTMGSKN